jgi:hypothetical protein
MSHATAETTAPLTLIHGEPVIMRPTRVLLGWLSDKEAVPHLFGRNPNPEDDLSVILPQIAAARAAVQARHVFVPADPVIGGDRELLDQIAARPELQAAIPDAPWTVEWVDLTRILSIQKIITTAGLDARVGVVNDDPEAIAELCLPVAQPVPPGGGFTDQDGLGFTISSLNPNLRVAGSQVHEALVASAPGAPPQKMQGITFFINMGTSYVQVARYQGRSFLRDGYHRTVGLLRAGVTRVPAVVIDAPSFQYIVPQPGLFDHEVAFSERPPLLTDFLDDTVSVEGSQPTIRKVVRVQAEQFVVQG